jgi:DNA-binding transcriptional LysR family regulator
MRLDSLEHIIKVAESSSISAAARKIPIQQTSLSAAIKSIEKEFNITIFNRQFDGVTLTKEGSMFIELSKSMLTLYHQMKYIGNTIEDVVSIYINPILYSFFCADIFLKLHAQLPELSTNIIEVSPENMAETMAKNSGAQIGIGYCVPDKFEQHRQNAVSHGFEVKPLICTEMLIYVNKNSSLARKQGIRLEDLQGECMIIGSHYIDLFVELKLSSVVKSFTTIDHPTPAPLVSVTQSDVITLAPDKAIMPKVLHPLIEDTVPLHIEGVAANGNYIHQYLVCRKKQRITDNEKNIFTVIFEHFRQED